MVSRATLELVTPPGEVFRVVADPTRLPSWHPTITTVDSNIRRGGTGLEVEVGLARGRSSQLRYTAVEPGRRVAFGYDSVNEDVVIIPFGTGSRLVYTVSRPTRIVDALGYRFNAGQNSARNGLAALRKLVEPEDASAEARNRSEFTQQAIEDLHREIRLHGSRRRVWRTLTIVLVVAAGLFAGLGVALNTTVYAAVFVFYALAPAFLWLSSTSSGHQLELRRLESQLEFEDPSVEPVERRAQRLFRLHQAELDKYYAQARQQSFLAFGVGFLCILLGFGVVIIAAAALFTTTAPAEAKIVVAALGAVGAIMANFIAVIALRMFSDSITSLGQLHQRLVTTHHLHFGNFLASKIANADLREKTVAAMATNIGHRTDSPAEDSESKDPNSTPA
jgi:hypothetical protein